MGPDHQKGRRPCRLIARALSEKRVKGRLDAGLFFAQCLLYKAQ